MKCEHNTKDFNKKFVTGAWFLIPKLRVLFILLSHINLVKKMLLLRNFQPGCVLDLNTLDFNGS